MSTAREHTESVFRSSEPETVDLLSELTSARGSFETIAEQLPQYIITLDRDLTIRWLNRAAEQSIGVPRAQLIGHKWPGADDPDNFCREPFEQALAGESVDFAGTDVSRPDSGRRIDGWCSPLRDAGGRVIGLVLVGHDATVRHAAEQALVASEERFRMLAEHSRDLVALLAKDGVLIYVNAAIRNLLGLEPKDVIGRSAFGLVHPDDVSRLRTRLAQGLDGTIEPGGPPFEYRVRHSNGSWRWLESFKTVLADAPLAGRLLIESRDVTERRAIEDALRQSEERYRLATIAMNGVIFEWNLATDAVIRTPGLGCWLAVDEADVPASMSAWLELVHPGDRIPPAELRRRLVRDGQMESEYRIRTPPGDYACLWERSVLVRDAAGAPERVVGFIVNRTDANRTQRLFEATESTARIGGWEQNFLTNVLYWTDEVYRLCDLEPARVTLTIEQTKQYFSPGSIPAVERAIRAASEDGTPFDIEARMVSATGRIWWARIAAHVERDEHGRPIRVYGGIQDITARKHTEIELRTKSSWLEVALSAAQMSAWRLDLVSGEIQTAARSPSLPPFARPPADLKALLSVVHPEDRERIHQALDTTLRTRDVFRTEYRTRLADDSVSWKSSVGRIEVNERGHPIGLIGATRDITARKLAEIGIRESERTLKQVTENSADILVLLDRDLRVRFTNRPARDTAGSFEGRSLRDLLPADDVERVCACLRQVLQTGRPDRYSLEHPDGAGGIRHFEFRASPVTDQGSIVGIALNGSDMTSHIMAERAIATQARMIESMLEGVAVVDPAQRIEITNPAFDRMFGYPRGALIGLEIDALSSSTEERGIVAREDGQLTREGAQPIEFEGQRCDGSYFAVAGIVTPFEVAGRDHRLVVLQDVSERKALEREILEASNREQHRIGADLHDGLGQELTGIALMLKGVAGRLATEYPDLLPEVDGITRLVSGAVESTRALARGLSPVSLERGSLLDALEGMTMRARDAYGIAVQFEHRIGARVDLDQTLADHLYRIAQEALTNAMRHGQAKSVLLKLTARAGRLRLQVADDGRGLPLDSIEAPGLGLKIMRYRARMVGGEVHFKRRRRGTLVICDCPVRMKTEPNVSRRSGTRRTGAADRRKQERSGA
jgi:PAS domain S-box-containing protein